MDSLTPTYERSRPPYPRTASRSSNSTTSTRMASQSANSSTSQIALSQMPSSHSTHRFHHATCVKPSTPRTPRLSREASIESTRQVAVSSFLQEKLQKERKAESEKMSVFSRSTTDMSMSSDVARGHHSPTKGGDSERRPVSSQGSEKKKGLGVKDMEQVRFLLNCDDFADESGYLESS